MSEVREFKMGFPDPTECRKCGKIIRFPYVFTAWSREELEEVLNVFRKNVLHFCRKCFNEEEKQFKENIGKSGYLEYRLLHNKDSSQDFVIKFNNKEDFDKWDATRKKGEK
ncbi:hypothetical protein LCGC14_0495140 [marine sediment metagenome]|uniref:Uncharacterized protein n=1 Tax=marine sediment metagenome TaxID=412755 RepID=A0A0F9SNX5_9ZZZZ